ncbi:hypothetical protein HR086_11095 [Myxococcus sp. CA039A]|nr:hypothetical protein [Myxococcus sp. CA039A]
MKQAALKGLADAPRVLIGEVISTEPGDFVHFLLVREDHTEELCAARVPLNPGAPQVTARVRIEGQWTVTESTKGSGFLTATFAGKSFTVLEDRSARAREWEAHAQPYFELPRAYRARPIRGIAMVTGERGVVVEDFKNNLRDSALVGDLKLVHVRLDDAEDVARGVRDAGALHVDLVVVARGGGGPADFIVFDNPTVVTAVAELTGRLPVLVAVGHHVNRKTYAAQVASYRSSTPADAGTFVREHNERCSARAVPADALVKSTSTAPVARPAPLPPPSAVPSERPAPPRPSSSPQFSSKAETPSDSKPHAWRRRSVAVALAVAVLAVLGAGGLVVHDRLESRLAEPTATPPPVASAAAAEVAPTPPVKPVPSKRKKRKPAPTPPKEAAPTVSLPPDAGFEWPPAATSTPQELKPIDVFE